VSPFFRAALEGQSEESAVGVVNLPEESADTFERFLGWLDCKDYDIMQSVKEANPRVYWSAIIHDHVFADKIEVEAFERNIIDHVVEAFRKTELKIMRLNSVLEIYTLTPENFSSSKPGSGHLWVSNQSVLTDRDPSNSTIDVLRA
jgi:hypothetical protein